jgi:mRNA-degrading endonuclease toxin of MazEF toxin-antitoxin module
MKRGAVYRHAAFPRQFVVISCDELTDLGTAIVAEIVPEVPIGMHGMLAVALRDDDPIHGAVLAWRVNYVTAARLGDYVGQLTEQTMETVAMSVRTAMDLSER